MLALAPPPAEGEELGWLFTSQWSTLAVLVMIAVAVLLVGGMLSRNASRRRARSRPGASFDLDVARMDSLPVTPARELAEGPAHVTGVIHSSVGVLGGAPGRECVYRNRAGGDRSTAVGSELIVVADASGRVAVENLEQARVLAPKRETGAHETISLHVGDPVQVLGVFTPDPSDHDDDPSQRVYGSFGSAGAVQLKVLSAARSTASPDAADPTHPTDPTDAPHTPAPDASP